MACIYCKKGFSCGCQKTKATDGSTVHKTCLANYNANLKKTNVSKDKITKLLDKHGWCKHSEYREEICWSLV